MKDRVHILLTVARIVCLGCIVTITWFLLEPRGVLALQPPPPPNTPTSTPMPTVTSKPTDTPVPTETPVPTDTPMPTNTAVPTPENTATPQPTETRAPTATPTAKKPPAVEPTGTPAPAETTSPVANTTNCQSTIEGYVVDGSGRRTQGATVMAQAEGWSGAILTDDQGQYGFSGLCEGSTTVQAFLPGGQATASKTITLTGSDSIKVDLSAEPQATNVPTATATSQAAAQSVTSEPGMPLTGSSGWLLSGAALLGLLMLLTAGARRVLNVYEASED